jgi:hypothetical protein
MTDLFELVAQEKCDARSCQVAKLSRLADLAD